MLRSLLSSLIALGLICGSAVAQKDTPKKDTTPVKDKEPIKDKKEEPKGTTVKVKSVDPKTNTLIVVGNDGKAMTYKVEKDVEIVGPRDGKSDDRLTDDRLAVGSEITLFYGKDNKTLTRIKLGYRKRETDKDKTPPKDKPVKDKKDK